MCTDLCLFTCLKKRCGATFSDQYTWHPAVAVPCRGALFRSSNRGALWGGDGQGTVRAQPAKKTQHIKTVLRQALTTIKRDTTRIWDRRT